MNIIAKEKGQTKHGSRWVVLQDGGNSYHITVQRGDVATYEHTDSLSSHQELMDMVHRLENELFPIGIPEKTE
jgi:hypothetical protein